MLACRPVRRPPTRAAASARGQRAAPRYCDRPRASRTPRSSCDARLCALCSACGSCRWPAARAEAGARRPRRGTTSATVAALTPDATPYIAMARAIVEHRGRAAVAAPPPAPGRRVFLAAWAGAPGAGGATGTPVVTSANAATLADAVAAAADAMAAKGTDASHARLELDVATAVDGMSLDEDVEVPLASVGLEGVLRPPRRRQGRRRSSGRDCRARDVQRRVAGEARPPEDTARARRPRRHRRPGPRLDARLPLPGRGSRGVGRRRPRARRDARNGRPPRRGDARRAPGRRPQRRRLPVAHHERPGTIRVPLPSGRRSRRRVVRVAPARRRDVRAARGLRGVRHAALPPEGRASARATSRRTSSTTRRDRASTSSTPTTRSSRRSAARASRSWRSPRTRRSRASAASSRPCAPSRARSSASSIRMGTFARTPTSRTKLGEEAKARAGLLPGRGGAGPAPALRGRPAARRISTRRAGRPTGSCTSATSTSPRTIRSTTTGSRTCSTTSTGSCTTTPTSSTRTRSRAPS